MTDSSTTKNGGPGAAVLRARSGLIAEVLDNAPSGAFFFVRLAQLVNVAIHPTGLSARSACFWL